MNLVRKFADKAAIEEVIGRVSGDPHSDHEEPYDDAKTGFGDVGGYIRFANGIEAFLSLGDFGIRGIEVIGSRGMIVNSDNTGLGLQLRLAPEGERTYLTEMEPVDVGFEPRPVPGAERGRDAAGWMDPGFPMFNIVDDTMRVLEEGGELEITTGDDLRHALEMSIAVRESARRGHAPVTLPLEDRSLAMYPERSRWHYKKPLLGEKAYMDILAQQKVET